MTPSIRFLSFSSLTTAQLYEILALRQRVFIVEQHCFYLDCDGNDQKGLHALMMDGDTLAGYARILPPGAVYNNAGITRIVLDEKYRGKGLGKTFVAACIEKTQTLYGGDITLTAQMVSKEFYEHLGFTPVGEIREVAGIPHTEMVLKHAKRAHNA